VNLAQARQDTGVILSESGGSGFPRSSGSSTFAHLRLRRIKPTCDKPSGAAEMGLKGPVKEGFEVSVPFAKYVGRQSSMYFQPVSSPNIKRETIHNMRKT
jgi:hypothetical protein